MIVESAAHLGATFLEIRPWMRRSISTTLSEIRGRSRCGYQDMVPVGNLGAALGQSIVWIYLAAEERRWWEWIALPEVGPFRTTPQHIYRYLEDGYPDAHRVHDGFRSVGCMQLVEDAAEVVAHRLFADPQASCDLFVR